MIYAVDINVLIVIYFGGNSISTKSYLLKSYLIYKLVFETNCKSIILGFGIIIDDLLRLFFYKEY
jgi:hypothetical protein